MVRSDRAHRSRAAVGRVLVLAAAGASLGACADLIGANFDPYEVEPTTTTGAGGAAPATATSTASGDATTVTTGDGGGGASSTSTATSSTSTGETCTEWPAGSGEWKWATQVTLDAGLSLQLASIIPSTTTLFPWVAVGSYQGTLFQGFGAEETTARNAPFFVAVGPSGLDLGGALAMACNEPCDGVEVNDAASDPGAWQGEGHGWAVGTYRGDFLNHTGNGQSTPFVLRFTQTADGAHALQTSTFLPSETKGLGDAGSVDAAFAGDGLVGVAGDTQGLGLFGLSQPQSGPQFFVGIALPFPIFLDRRAGRITGITSESACIGERTGQHLRELDVAVVGSHVWTVGRHCARGPQSTTLASEPGDGFVLVEDVGDNVNPPLVESPTSAALNFGAGAMAIAQIDAGAAVVAGEVPRGDPTPSLPTGEDPFISQSDSAGWVSLVDFDAGGPTLSARWATVIDAPGDQHVTDVAVRKVDADTTEIFVAGTTDAPFEDGGFTSSCAPEGTSFGFIAKLDGEGNVVWVRTFGREGVVPISLRIGEEGVVVGAMTGVGDYELEPSVAADPIHLDPASASFFVGELSF